MTTRALEELDGGLGSCQVDEDLSAPADPCPGRPREDRAQATSRLADSSSWPRDSQEPAAEGSTTGGVDAWPRKTEKEPVAKVASGPEAVAGEAEAPAPVPEPWVPPSSALKEPASPLPKSMAWAPPPGPLEPPAKVEERAAVPRSSRATGKDKGESEEAAEEEPVPLADRGPKERRKKEERLRKERPRKERPQKEERPRRERPRKEERPRAAGEALPRRWEARERGHPAWAGESGDPEHRKRQAWASPRRPDEEDRPPGRQKHHAGKGRD
ncbi:junctional sarcoplasmic reticulum protein 1 isoform X2 [Physeter macrocephalus]|uniref:Junctional sarcoplasmic reticulum protein 1 isoform X2 n=1 Tax=Physeter macrocephalus TaxID=9755 RepID=A0A455C5F8_PHYMC|nr:junctional sarcoplasmic reticulum protein 1 isoform X2 [Physeter catodon]|eukprot:XP_028356664.1 junctional sarcoplasmic reticulum protein 1 isoform X2 [Physeter catodon]